MLIIGEPSSFAPYSFVSISYTILGEDVWVLLSSP